MIYDRTLKCRLIYVVDPTLWNKTWLGARGESKSV